VVQDVSALSVFFSPKSVAVVGASSDPKKPGNAALRERNAREQGKRDGGLPTVPSTVAEERATNPFLRVDSPAVLAAAEAHAGHRLADAVETFAVVREWKNGFR
jgi:hydroxyacylglutathione hydrolase